MDREQTIPTVFGVPRALIGMIHVGALPGTPGSRSTVAELAEVAADEARAYAAAGLDGVAIENMHDRPYLRGTVGPEITAAMTAVGTAVRRAIDLPIGVQVLAGANREALAVAMACDAAFVRVEGFVFAHVADEGVIESDAGELLRYRCAIGAEDVKIFADIKKKHSAHALTADLDLAETAAAAEFFLADGVIVTGVASGRATAPDDLAVVSAAVGVPTLVGSGVTADNIHRYAAADALIVGSSLKHGGSWANPVDPARLERLVEAFAELPAPGASHGGRPTS